MVLWIYHWEWDSANSEVNTITLMLPVLHTGICQWCGDTLLSSITTLSTTNALIHLQVEEQQWVWGGRRETKQWSFSYFFAAGKVNFFYAVIWLHFLTTGQFDGAFVFNFLISIFFFLKIIPIPTLSYECNSYFETRL